MTALSEDRERELRESGWSDAEIRDYRRGWESAVTASEGRSWVPTAPPPRPAPEYLRVHEHFPRNSEKGRWQRETFAGALSTLLPPADDAGELAEAKRLQDDKEYRYGNRPELAPCLTAVRHNGSHGMTVSGTTAEVAQVFRNAGIAVVVAEAYEPPGLAPGTQPKISRV